MLIRANKETGDKLTVAGTATVNGVSSGGTTGVSSSTGDVVLTADTSSVGTVTFASTTGDVPTLDINATGEGAIIDLQAAGSISTGTLTPIPAGTVTPTPPLVQTPNINVSLIEANNNSPTSFDSLIEINSETLFLDGGATSKNSECPKDDAGGCLPEQRK